jgi:hypothetical protein
MITCWMPPAAGTVRPDLPWLLLPWPVLPQQRLYFLPLPHGQGAFLAGALLMALWLLIGIHGSGRGADRYAVINDGDCAGVKRHVAVIMWLAG